MCRTAVLLVLVLWLSASVSVAGTTDEAQDRFEKGVELYNNGDFEGALVEFKVAYKVEPHFAVRYNIGICLYKLHRYDEAVEEMISYLDEGGEDVPTEKRAEIESILEELESYVGALKVSCNVDGASLWVDGDLRVVLPTGDLLRFNVGEYVIEVKADGYETFKRTVLLPGGSVSSLKVVLEPTSSGGSSIPSVSGTGDSEEKSGNAGKGTSGPVSPGKDSGKNLTGVWVSLGVTGALGIATIVTGAMSLSRKSEFDQLYQDQEDEWEKLASEGESLTLATDVLLGLTAAGAIATIVIAVVVSRKSSKERVAMIAPFVGERVAGLSLLWRLP